MTTARILALAFIVVAARSTCARAQDGNIVAIGGNLSAETSVSGSGSGSFSGGLIWRLGHGGSGWGPAYGFSWFSTRVEQSVAGLPVRIGQLRVKPFMGGYSYTHVIGPVAVSGNLLGGFALTSFHVAPAASDAYRDRLGARTFGVDSANTFVVKPELEMWLDVSRKIGINVNVGYMLARPELTVTSSLGEDVYRVRADRIMIKTGLVYSIF